MAFDALQPGYWAASPAALERTLAARSAEIRYIVDEHVPMEHVIQIVERVLRAGVHLQLAFSAVPGYRPGEELPAPLFRTEEALAQYLAFWQQLAELLASYDDRLSFVPLEQPRGYWRELPDLGPAEYAVLIRKTADAIHRISPARPICVDGMDGGVHPPTDLFDLTSRYVSLCMTVFPANTHQAQDRLRAQLAMWSAYTKLTGQRVVCLLPLRHDETLAMIREMTFPCLVRLG